MSGRINPREYDLGELRDAVRETARRDGVQTGTTTLVDLDIELRNRTACERDEGTYVAEDPEAYVRSRRRLEHPDVDDRRRVDDRSEGRSDTDRAGTDARSRHRSGSKSSSKAGVELCLDRPVCDSCVESKPYLEELPRTYGAQLEIFEWLDRMLSKAGRRETRSALAYYESIEWLSAESRAELETFVSGLETTGAEGGSLGISDHRESLMYVVGLADRRRR